MSARLTIAGRDIGIDTLPYIVAELGVNHDGDLARAHDLVWKAARMGASAVKFQVYKADTIAHPNSPTYFRQNGNEAKTQHEFFRRYDAFGEAEYRALAQTAKEAGVAFLVTPFDIPSVGWLNDLVPAWKIASADITNLPLLATVAETGKPVILSTGASTLREVDIAQAFLRAGGAPHVALLHCVLSYPTPPEDANLLMITDLAERFRDSVIGYSDHTVATEEMEVCTMAYLLGARIIEKHFTDDKLREGNDHYHSMEPNELLMLKNFCDWVHGFFGASQKGVVEIENVSRRMARRGLYAARDLQVGDILDTSTVAILRPAADIGPEEWGRVAGRIVTRPYLHGEPLHWEDVA